MSIVLCEQYPGSALLQVILLVIKKTLGHNVEKAVFSVCISDW